ncbi:methylase [Legionella sp. PC1000]|uniref:SAM-dependent methyltransferase n=1 Tax=Legionella sp. PC1000 TaxID=2746060 RepID=UPI0015FA7E56|nr:SAM-dependent methyltransferase [Legionella sp. PC1000]QLZ68981.1 methylase [Legionella sp. PC1000]
MSKLIVCGSGIKSVSHLTEETKYIIKNSDKVLYLVNEHNLKSWIQRESKKAENLEKLYFNSDKRIDSYSNITNYIISEYNKGIVLCVLFYGHPTIFSESALNAVKKIKEDNGSAIILPGISTFDCLCSDLEIDPGDKGCLTMDATELLLYERNIDTNAHVILWQVANLGMHDNNQTSKIQVLFEYLNKFYTPDHFTYLYEAAQVPMKQPRIEQIKLRDLIDSKINQTTTLYLPPAHRKELSEKYLQLLGSVNQFSSASI